MCLFYCYHILIQALHCFVREWFGDGAGVISFHEKCFFCGLPAFQAVQKSTVLHGSALYGWADFRQGALSPNPLCISPFLHSRAFSMFSTYSPVFLSKKKPPPTNNQPPPTTTLTTHHQLHTQLPPPWTHANNVHNHGGPSRDGKGRGEGEQGTQQAPNQLLQ